MCDTDVVHQGMSVAFDEVTMKAKLEQDDIVIEAKVGDGHGNAVAYGCDLTYDYVRINASYRT